MTRASIRGYVVVMRARYSPASKKEMGDTLGKFTKVTGRRRQAAVRPSRDGDCVRRIDGSMELLLRRGVVTTNIFPYNCLKSTTL